METQSFHKTPTIIIDTREPEALVQIILSLCQDQMVKTERLPIGDIIVRDLVIERKTGRDFILSLINGRLFRQLHFMKSRFNRSLLLIEGEVPSDTKMHPNALQGAIVRITAGWQIPVLFTSDMNETASTMSLFANQELLRTSAPITSRWGRKGKKLETQQLRILASIPHVGPVRAGALINKFESLRAVFTAPVSELSEVPGIGSKMARLLEALFTHKRTGPCVIRKME